MSETKKSAAMEAAEAAKLQAEAAMLQAQARKFEAEALRAAAEAETAQSFTRVSALQVAEAEREAREIAANDWRNNTYWFDGEVTRGSVSTCIDRLTHWDRMEPDSAWTIMFNSPGGQVIAGMALFDFLRAMSAKGHHITTVVRGYAASMAGILLQAGDERIIGPESYLMIHEISAGTGGKIGEIQDAVKFYETICDRVVDIFVKRSGKCSRAVFIKNWKRQDWWLTSEQTVRFGFADKIG